MTEQFTPRQLVEAKLSDADWGLFEYVGWDGFQHQVRQLRRKTVWEVFPEAIRPAVREGLVLPLVCGRCRGTGNVEARRVHLGAPGTCFECDGRRFVEGDANTLAAAEAARSAHTDREHTYRAWERRVATENRDARNGAWALMNREPERFEKLKDAIAANRPVEEALVAYLRQAEAELSAE